MRIAGVGLVVAAYALLLYTSLTGPAYARAHPHLDAALLAQYAGSWPIALASAVPMCSKTSTARNGCNCCGEGSTLFRAI